MKKLKKIILFTVVLILFVTTAAAGEISQDTADTGSITEEAVIQDTDKVSDTTGNTQNNKVSDNIMDEKTVKSINKTTKNNVKASRTVEVKNWEQLTKEVKDAAYTAYVTIKLKKGNYTNTGTIKYTNKYTTVIIEGNGQTIDANRKRAFEIGEDVPFIIKNVTITNALSGYGGAIFNDGKLEITQSTFTNNEATMGGAVYNNKYATMKITNSIFFNNYAEDIGSSIQ